MTLRVRFHPLASTELVDAQLWYETRNPGLGDRLLRAVEEAISELTKWPNAGTPVRVDTDEQVYERKVATAAFPYVIVYRTSERAIEVLAFHHERRRPLYWAARSQDQGDAASEM